jgi:hypothetical protein
LPWLTYRAYPWLADELRHQNAVLALLRADKAPDEVLEIYETKRARLEIAIAKFAARITKRVS